MPARPVKPLLGRRVPGKKADRKNFEDLTVNSIKSDGTRLRRLVASSFHWGGNYNSTIPMVRNRGNTTINLNNSPDAIYVKDRGRTLKKLIPQLAHEVKTAVSLSAPVKRLKCMRCLIEYREPRSPYCAFCNKESWALNQPLEEE